jgi:hypothetical protein
MFGKVALIGLLALAAANAETFKIKFYQPSVIQGTELKPGEYRMTVEGDKLTVMNGKQAIEAPVKVENADQKFNNTAVRYKSDNSITEIRVGGTKTKLVFSN